MSQLEFVMADTGCDAEYRQALGEQHDQERGGRASARPRRRRSRCCSGSPRRSSACRRRSSPSARASSPAAARRSPTAQLLGGKLFNVSMPASWNMNPTGGLSGGFNGPRPRDPGQGIRQVRRRRSRSASTSWSARRRRRGSTSRRSSPGARSTSRTSACPGCCTGASCARAARRVYGFGAPIVSVDESSIKHIPDVQIVRKGDFLGVVAPHEYDAIQAAAQLKVKWADPPAVLPGGGNEFKRDAGARSRRQDGYDPQRRPTRPGMSPNAVMLTRRWPRRRTSSAASTASPRSSTPRSARSARSPT